LNINTMINYNYLINIFVITNLNTFLIFKLFPTA